MRDDVRRELRRIFLVLRRSGISDDQLIGALRDAGLREQASAEGVERILDAPPARNGLGVLTEPRGEPSSSAEAASRRRMRSERRNHDANLEAHRRRVDRLRAQGRLDRSGGSGLRILTGGSASDDG
jgi:hypothetical protein